MTEFSGRRRSALWPMIAVGGVVLVGAAVLVFTQAPHPAATPEPSPVSAIEACHLPSSAVKGGATIDYQWQVAVRLDSPQQSTILFVSGTNRLLCQADRGPDGTYPTVTAAGGGLVQMPADNALTWDEGNLPPQSGTDRSQLIVGHAPSGTAWVDVLTSDGEDHNATIGNGWYMAWAILTGPTDSVVEIDARDSKGNILARLSDPAGLQAGGSGALAAP